MMSGTPWMAVCLAVLFLIALALYWIAPAWATRPPREFPDHRFDAADRYRQTVFGALGGLAVLMTFAWTFTKDRETLRQSADQDASRQYLDAAKMLADPGVSTKTAAVFAFGNLAATQPSLYLPVRETIVSFVRNEHGESGGDVDSNLGVPLVDSAVRAALTVLGRRDTANDDPRWPLTLDDAFLNGASFHHLMSFRGASFQGAHIHGADFRCADLDKAVFDGAMASDYMAFRQWTDSQADAGSWDAWRKYRFIANFEGASLRGAQFRGAGLAGARFVNADISGADFSRANLSRADFAGARNVSEARFSDVGGSACADASARFDGNAVNLKACKVGQPVRPTQFRPLSASVTFSAGSGTCALQVRP